MNRSYLSVCVYPQNLPAGLAVERLPGLKLEELLNTRIDDLEILDSLQKKLEHICRKTAMMCVAAERAIYEEKEFYSSTIEDASALFGKDAIEIAYHLEAFILFARSSLDIAATLFGHFLFARKRYDSFNELCKSIVNKAGGPEGLVKGGHSIEDTLPGRIFVHQTNEQSWLSATVPAGWTASGENKLRLVAR
jgi:hypothetical protein